VFDKRDGRASEGVVVAAFASDACAFAQTIAVGLAIHAPVKPGSVEADFKHLCPRVRGDDMRMTWAANPHRAVALTNSRENTSR
jgi:hypothetical protein